MRDKNDPLVNKIREWENMNDHYINEIKSKITQWKTEEALNIISYFTYSLNLAHGSDRESMLLGSYHIHNIGSQTLSHPYICLKISSKSPFHFSGKYMYKEAIQKLRVSEAWERLNEGTNKEEYWLKPYGQESLKPGEQLSFSNFQLKWLPDRTYAGSMMGFTYGEEKKEGLPALNQISISGSNDGEEPDQHE